jgi:hypothetical protein
MTVYVTRGNTVHPQEDAENFQSTLPVAVYTVEKSMFGFYLQRSPDIQMPTGKIYGDVYKKTERIAKTFSDRSVQGMNTGVLLTGTKGSGKTLLSKTVSANLLKAGVPTILVGGMAPESIDGFIKFVNLIDGKCCMLFDEFEKNYDKEDQARFLTLFDGTSSGSKLFLVTVNDMWQLNSFMLNRPGRLYYRFDYSGLEESFIKEYLDDNLKNRRILDSAFEIISRVFKNRFTFDMLQSTIEEMNRFDIDIKEAVSVLNIDVDDTEYEAKVYFKGNFVATRKISELDYFEIALSKSEIGNTSDDDESNTVSPSRAYEHFQMSDFVSHDPAKGCMIYKKGDFAVHVSTTRDNSKTRSYFLDAF